MYRESNVSYRPVQPYAVGIPGMFAGAVSCSLVRAAAAMALDAFAALSASGNSMTQMSSSSPASVVP